MRKCRFFCESITEHSLLDPSESNHISRVLRLSEGSPVELFDGRGTLAEGTIESLSRKQVIVHATDISQTPPKKSGRIILAVSFAKGQRFDWLIEKCTELGADHIAAVQFERTVKLGKASAMQRYQKIAATAAKQSQRIFLPTISGPEKFSATLDLLKREYPDPILLYGDPSGMPLQQAQLNTQHKDIIVVIGPEGGLCESEIEFLKAEQSLGVSINRNILRIETAAAAFCSLLSAHQPD
jgi:16S rRNA (uracil1498-N3)-methyltransferase